MKINELKQLDKLGEYFVEVTPGADNGPVKARIRRGASRMGISIRLEDLPGFIWVRKVNPCGLRQHRFLNLEVGQSFVEHYGEEFSEGTIRNAISRNNSEWRRYTATIEYSQRGKAVKVTVTRIV